MNTNFQCTGLYTVIGSEGIQKKYLTFDVSTLSDKAVSAIMNMYDAWADVPISQVAVPPVTSATVPVEVDDEDDEAVPGPDKSRAATNVYEKLRADNERVLANDLPIRATGWTAEAVREALRELQSTQKKVILKAVENGGQISRAETYQVAQFPSNRSLKGFTRPVAGVMAQLKEKGTIPDTAEPLLSTIYDASIKTYQPVQGFKVPLEVVKMLRS